MTTVQDMWRKDDELIRLRTQRDALLAENSRLRDVLAWTDDNCLGECKGVARRALEHVAIKLVEGK